MKISILTATYNRSSLLTRLYKSIKKNAETYSNIEWLIMDDGSKVSPKGLVNNWEEHTEFPIKFFEQGNMGKMSAINSLVKKATGDIIIEMDDDDFFHEDVFSMIASDYEKIKDNEQVYGIIYEKELTKYNKKINKNLDNRIIRLYDLHYKENASFDMALTFKANYRKKFRYELEGDEKFVTEARMYYKMDKQHMGLLIRTSPIMTCEYQGDGYSAKIKEIFKSNPYGYYEYFKELINYESKGILFNKRIYMLKHYILFSYLTNRKYHDVIHNARGINRFLLRFMYLPGKISSKTRFGD